MDGALYDNDISHVVEADRAHVWHHLIQHKPFETNDPRIIVEGKGMKVWDQNGKEHIDGVSGGVWTVNVRSLHRNIPSSGVINRGPVFS